MDKADTLDCDNPPKTTLILETMSKTDDFAMLREKVAEMAEQLNRIEEAVAKEREERERRRHLEEKVKELAEKRQRHNEKVATRRARMVSRVDCIHTIAAYPSMSASIRNIFTDLH